LQERRIILKSLLPVATPSHTVYSLYSGIHCIVIEPYILSKESLFSCWEFGYFQNKMVPTVMNLAYTYIYTGVYIYINPTGPSKCAQEFDSRKREYIYTYICIHSGSFKSLYGVASISRLLKIIGLFCKRAL